MVDGVLVLVQTLHRLRLLKVPDDGLAVMARGHEVLAAGSSLNVADVVCVPVQCGLEHHGSAVPYFD